MKKILFSLLMLLGTTAAVAQHVATTVELQRAVMANPAAQITLTTDIDVSPLGKLRETFTGTIDGGEDCCIITGITEPLFDTVDGATFRNITFKDCTIQTDSHYHVGLIAANATGGCRFENINIRNCVVNSNFKPEWTDEELGQYTLFAGELVGGSDGSTFVGCSTDDQSGVYSQSVFMDLLNFIYIGGLVGHSENDVYEHCVNRALVSGDCYVGGLAGWAKKAQVSSCINAGTIIVSTDRFAEIFAKYKSKDYDSVTKEYDGQTYTLQAFTQEDLQGQNFEDSFISYVYAGGMFGYMFNGSTMTNCVNLAFLTMGLPLGGLVGESDYSVIDRCFNYGSSKVGRWGYRFHKGGIVGMTNGTTVSNCLNAGTLECNNGMYGYGSIAGTTYEGSKIYNCISTTPCTILASRVLDGDGLLDENTSGNNYYVKPDIEYVERAWERGVTEEQLRNGLVVYWTQLMQNHGISYGEGSPWRQNIGEDDYPVLDPTHSIVTLSDIPMPTISTATELKAFAKKVEDGDVYAMARLASDINMQEQKFCIGSFHNPYCGIFDGAGHTIDNIRNVDYSIYDNVSFGLFGAVGHQAEIHNLISGAKNVLFTVRNDGASGIVGQVKGKGERPELVFIENCGSYASVEGGTYAGGILGNVNTPDDKMKVYVSNCFNMGNIISIENKSGVLCGYTRNNAIISNCWSGGTLTASNSSGTNPYTTVNGDNRFFAGFDSKITLNNCYTIASKDNIQGLGNGSTQKGVTEQSAEILASGKLTFLLNGSTNEADKLSWQQNIGTDKNPVPGNKGVHHTRQINSMYGTICLPFTVRSDEEISFYLYRNEHSETDGVTLKFEYAEDVFPAMPALFRVSPSRLKDGPIEVCFRNTDKFFINETNGRMLPTWDMMGTFEQKVFEGEAAKSIYYISNGEIRNAQKITIAPYRAYIEGPSIDELTANGASQARIRFVIEDEDGSTADIELVGADLVPAQKNGKTYSLMGTVVNDNYRGIVIKNGRKVKR